MADDTRLPRSPAAPLPSPDTPINRDTLTVSPENKPFTGTQWQNGKQIPYTAPPENANMMPGGTQHTAGGAVVEPTLVNAFGTVKLEEFRELHKRPCVRDALMVGIGAGAGVGGIRGLLGAKVWTACSWAVASWMGASTLMHQYCKYQRQTEKEGMMRAMEILDKKGMEKKAREARKEKAREERRKAKEEELEVSFAKAGENVSSGSAPGKSWWKVW
ncbi:hypothetical protein LTR95_000549 [Oleoguttula sp. CCFEE 5521]